MPKYIALVGKHGKGRYAIVDDEEYDRLSQFRWHLHEREYVYRSSFGKTHYMHHEVIGRVPGLEVDHVNCVKYDNRRSNLRHCRRDQNASNMKIHRRNTSGYKGVVKEGSTWRAQITVNRKVKKLGRFKSPLEAAMTYDAAARKIRGEFARTNF